MIPLFSTEGPTSITCPPVGVVMVPWLATLPAMPLPAKRMRPERKSSLDRPSDEATRPATSIRAPAPKTMPFGLMSATRPLDCSVPRICEGSTPVTRLSTLESALCCTKRVVSPAPMEKDCQLMMAPGVLVTVRVDPCLAIDAWPLTTDAPVGFPHAGAWKAHATANATAETRNRDGPVECRMVLISTPWLIAAAAIPQRRPVISLSVRRRELNALAQCVT
jgi:hypothetical protein